MIKSLALFAALTVTSCTPALAFDGTWHQGEYWTVYVSLKHKNCTAAAQFDNNRALMFTSDGNSIMFSIGGLGLDDGTYKTVIKTDKSLALELVGQSINGLLAFKGINNKAEVAIKEGELLYIDGVGSFRLEGSKKALEEVVTCGLTLQDTI